MELSPVPIRVLVVEDSLVARELLVSILKSVPGIQVVGTAQNGVEAVHLAQRLRPSVITMDIYMPEMDGLEATQRIMSEAPCPIVVITAGLDQGEQDLSFKAIQAGALTVIKKPSINDPPAVMDTLVRQVKSMSEVKVVRRWSWATLVGDRIAAASPAVTTRPATVDLVAIAVSTGGPAALAEILGHLPASFPVPILVVQHITPGFGSSLTTWLNQQTPLEVRLAQAGDSPRPGQVLFAPDDRNMEMTHQGSIALNQDVPALGRQRPSADRLFYSVAHTYGPTAIGVILTGMGDDGAAGLKAMRETGARTIAQDAQSCVVFGMPAAAISLRAADQVLPLSRIGPTLCALLGRPGQGS